MLPIAASMRLLNEVGASSWFLMDPVGFCYASMVAGIALWVLVSRLLFAHPGKLTARPAGHPGAPEDGFEGSGLRSLGGVAGPDSIGKSASKRKTAA